MENNSSPCTISSPAYQSNYSLEIRTGWKSDKSDNGVYYAWIKEGKWKGGGRVLEFDIEKILKFYLEIEGMFDDSYAY